jgi:tetratricopeptide (TPR) repeat protein
VRGWSFNIPIILSTRNPLDEELANLYNNMGTTESAIGRQDEAIAYFHRAEKIWTELSEPHDSMSFSMTYMNVGRAMYLKKEYTSAADLYQRAEKILLVRGGSDSFAMIG